MTWTMQPPQRMSPLDPRETPKATGPEHEVLHARLADLHRRHEELETQIRELEAVLKGLPAKGAHGPSPQPVPEGPPDGTGPGGLAERGPSLSDLIDAMVREAEESEPTGVAGERVFVTGWDRPPWGRLRPAAVAWLAGVVGLALGTALVLRLLP